MANKQPIGFRPAPIAAADHAILREVALAYRRARRAGDMDLAARNVAMDRNFELRPDAIFNPLAAEQARAIAARFEREIARKA